MTPQTLTPAELDELERLRSDLNKNHHRACLCSLCVERYENYKVGVLAAAPALLAMARRLGELQYRWGEFSASNLANLHSLNAQLTAATARVAELDAALTTALADAEMAEHAHDACEELLTAATDRAEALEKESREDKALIKRITRICPDCPE